MDAIYFALALVFLASCWGLLQLCDHLMGG